MIQNIILDDFHSSLMNQDMNQFIDTVIDCECQNGCDLCTAGKIVLTKQNIYIYQKMLSLTFQEFKKKEQKEENIQNSIQIFNVNIMYDNLD